MRGAAPRCSWPRSRPPAAAAGPAPGRYQATLCVSASASAPPSVRSGRARGPLRLARRGAGGRHRLSAASAAGAGRRRDHARTDADRRVQRRVRLATDGVLSFIDADKQARYEVRPGARADGRRASVAPAAPALRRRHRGRLRRGARAASRALRVGLARRREQRLGLALPRRSRPSFITSTRCDIARTTARSWLMNEVAHAVAALQVDEQGEHLLLHRDVERRGRLVEHQDLGPQHHRARRSRCAGAGRPRTRADSGRARRPCRRRRRGRPRRASAATSVSRSSRDELGPMQLEALADDPADGHARAERAERILEHHLHAPAQPPARLGRRRPVGVAVERDAARRRSAAARAAPCRASSCPSPTRRRCRASRRGEAASVASPHRVEAAAAEPAVRDVEADAQALRPRSAAARRRRSAATSRRGRLASRRCV